MSRPPASGTLHAAPKPPPRPPLAFEEEEGTAGGGQAAGLISPPHKNRSLPLGARARALAIAGEGGGLAKRLNASPARNESSPQARSISRGNSAWRWQSPCLRPPSRARIFLVARRFRLPQPESCARLAHPRCT